MSDSLYMEIITMSIVLPALGMAVVFVLGVVVVASAGIKGDK